MTPHGERGHNELKALARRRPRNARYPVLKPDDRRERHAAVLSHRLRRLGFDTAKLTRAEPGRGVPRVDASLVCAGASAPAQHPVGDPPPRARLLHSEARRPTKPRVQVIELAPAVAGTSVVDCTRFGGREAATRWLGCGTHVGRDS